MYSEPHDTYILESNLRLGQGAPSQREEML